MKITEVDMTFYFQIGSTNLANYVGKVMHADRGMNIYVTTYRTFPLDDDDNTLKVLPTKKTVLLTNKEVNVRKNSSKRAKVIQRLGLHYNVREAFEHFDGLIKSDWSSFAGYIRKQKHSQNLYVEMQTISEFLIGKLLTHIESNPYYWTSERYPTHYLDVRVEDFKILKDFTVEKERQRLLAATAKYEPSAVRVKTKHKI